MRSAIAAAVLCLPAIVSAQAVHTGVSHFVAAMDAPAFAFQASVIKADLPRIYSGLIAPVRLTSIQLMPAITPTPNGEVVVEYTVNTAGVPEDVHVTKPLELSTDQRVVDAVKRVRYTPGKLDGSVVAVPVTLHVAITR